MIGPPLPYGRAAEGPLAYLLRLCPNRSAGREPALLAEGRPRHAPSQQTPPRRHPRGTSMGMAETCGRSATRLPTRSRIQRVWC